MNITKHCFVLAILISVLCACDDTDTQKAMSFPTWPQEEIYTYDTIDCSKLCCVPKNAITVREAIKIGKALGSGNTSQETYYIKGVVKSFNASKHESGMKDWGNGCFYIADNATSSVEFYGYQVMGLNGAKFTSLDQLKIGDFVVICSKITNYNGTIETVGKSAAYIVCTTNELNYPETDVVYYDEQFAESLGKWTTKVVADPGVTVWKHNITQKGKTSAIAQALLGESENLAGEVWLVSPSIDLRKCTTQSVKLTFSTYYLAETVTSTVQPEVADFLRLKVSKNGTQWDDIEIPNFNSGKLATYVPDTIDISAYVSASTRVAFAYKSTTEFAPKWSICNVTVCEKKRAITCN